MQKRGRRGFSPEQRLDGRGTVIPVSNLQQYFHESIE